MSVKSFERAIKIFQRLSKKQKKAQRKKFFTLRAKISYAEHIFLSLNKILSVKRAYKKFSAYTKETKKRSAYRTFYDTCKQDFILADIGYACNAEKRLQNTRMF